MKDYTFFAVVLAFFSFTLETSVLAESDSVYTETGLPLIRNFNSNDYNAHSQNWAVLQDHDGVMYFGNGSGILQYDGVSWRLLRMPSKALVGSLAINRHGLIYVSGQGEFGFLAPDSTGQLHFVSLLDKVAPEFGDFSPLGETLVTNAGAFFKSRRYLFYLNDRSMSGSEDVIQFLAGSKLRVWEAETRFHKSFAINNSIYLTQPGIGLMKLQRDSLQLVRGGEQFANINIYFMLLFPDSHQSQTQQILIGTREKQLLVYDGTNFRPYPVSVAVQDLIKENQLFSGVWLPDGNLALLFRSGGLAIVDQGGRLVQILNEESGLQDEVVRAAYTDREGGLWLALNNGLARVEIPSPFSYHNSKTGLAGSVIAMTRHNGRMYVAGSRGLHTLANPSVPKTNIKFIPLKKIDSHAWSLLSLEDRILAATTNHIYDVTTSRPFKIHDLESRHFYRSRYHPDLIYVGLQNGLALLYRFQETWHLGGKVSGIYEEVRSIDEETPETLWLGLLADGLLRVRIPDLATLIADLKKLNNGAIEFPANVERFEAAQGMPSGNGWAFNVDGQTRLATTEGLRRFDSTTNTFVPDSSIGVILNDSRRSISNLLQRSNGDILLNSNLDDKREIGVATRLGYDISLPEEAGTYTWNTVPFLRVANWGVVYFMYEDLASSSTLWFGGAEGVVRYDETVRKDYKVDFRTLIRRVVVQKDSVIYGGAFLTRNTKSIGSWKEKKYAPKLPHISNSLRFEYAATSYEDPSKNRYQTFLTGFDNNWSNWTGETQKDYTNLPEGHYTFKVRATNVYGHRGEESGFSFVILPPWYRTWWALLGFCLFFAGFFGMSMYSWNRWRTKNLQNRNLELAAIVKARTVELAHKNLALQERDALKSRFFTNISHEFRTPLSLIMGQLDLLSGNFVDKRSENLDIARRNTQRLLLLINQLLDLAKLDASQLKLKACKEDIVPMIRQFTAAFESIARLQKIFLHFESTQERIMVYVERDKIEKVINNLLANAVKFTEEQGIIWVKIEPFFTEQPEVRITVKNTGLRIPPENLPYIFDRFYHVDNSPTRKYEGTGIGLALTKELVQLHGGGISVESDSDSGTTFTVILPLGSSHLQPEQISQDDHEPLESSSPDPLTPVTVTELEAELCMPNISSQPVIHIDNTSIRSEKDAELILIVEDNPDMREYIAESFAENYNIREAANGAEGFSKAVECVPDLIIADIMMPDVDGFELTRRLRSEESTSHIPIIILTAKATEEDRFQGLEIGADAYIIKPFNRRELKIQTQKLINRRRELRQQIKTNIALALTETSISSLDQQFVQRFHAIIEANIGNEEFNVDLLAEQLAIGKRQLQRKVKALIDYSPIQYIRMIRLKHARRLLERNAGNVSEIAFRVGYRDVTAFSRAFREEFGKSPSAVLRSEGLK